MASYGTLAGWRAYATARGNGAPTSATDANGDAALLRASAYIDGLYGIRFAGRPTGGATQALAWPRTGAVDYYGQSIPPDSIPDRVVSAAYEAALLELASPGSLTVTLTPDQRKVLTKVDKIEWEVITRGKAGVGFADATPTSTLIEGLLWPLLVRTDEPAIMVV
ncbi:DnaT-like ssDNA-binding protein [Ancylobacter sp.]|uniref:DnaT-like ssDNA-binding protein n=1 Tax=Ancylobacter sp. TaxID=1872567 RepID=UPI003D12FD6B